MPPTITIRHLTRRDAAAAGALSGDLGYPADPGVMEARLGAILAEPDHAVLGAEGEDGSLLGWVHVCFRLLLIDPPSAFVEGLVVAPETRRGGVGRALMAAAEDWARDRGAQAVRLRSGAPRADAHAFYRALGYREGKAALGFEKDLGPGSARQGRPADWARCGPRVGSRPGGGPGPGEPPGPPAAG
jgi:GNAT superfamily N-acetyltransferase